MDPYNSQPAKLYRTAKTHKFNNINEGKKEKSKFGSIIDQTGKYTYNAAQAISKYLKLLGGNEYTVDNTHIFSKHVKDFTKRPLHYKKMKNTCPMWNHCLPIFPLMKPLNIF